MIHLYLIVFAVYVAICLTILTMFHLMEELAEEKYRDEVE